MTVRGTQAAREMQQYWKYANKDAKARERRLRRSSRAQAVLSRHQVGLPTQDLLATLDSPPQGRRPVATYGTRLAATFSKRVRTCLPLLAQTAVPPRVSAWRPAWCGPAKNTGHTGSHTQVTQLTAHLGCFAHSGQCQHAAPPVSPLKHYALQTLPAVCTLHAALQAAQLNRMRQSCVKHAAAAVLSPVTSMQCSPDTHWRSWCQ